MAETQAAASAAIMDIMEADIAAVERRNQLLAIQAELDAAAAEVSEALEAVEEARAADHTEVELAIMALRSRATRSEEMLDAGETTREELAEAGLLSHSDLDDLEEEGLLETAALQMLGAGTVSTEDDVHPLLVEDEDEEAPLREPQNA